MTTKDSGESETFSERIKGILSLGYGQKAPQANAGTAPSVASSSAQQSSPSGSPAPIKVGKLSPMDREELVGTPSDVGVFMGHGFSGKFTFKRLFQNPKTYQNSSSDQPSSPSKKG